LLTQYQPGVIMLDMDLIIRLLAVGVETAPERDFLGAAGIHLMQGYLFCQPAFQAIGVNHPVA
jgi:EAL domain-containing protein (putative c-di-GMP-specific phosphodiesterase class I)